MALVSTLFGCGDDDGVLNDQDARRLVEQVLADLDLPGEPEPPIDPAEIPEGELPRRSSSSTSPSVTARRPRCPGFLARMWHATPCLQTAQLGVARVPDLATTTAQPLLASSGLLARPALWPVSCLGQARRLHYEPGP
jgi:hypothetical protein